MIAPVGRLMTDPRSRTRTRMDDPDQSHADTDGLADAELVQRTRSGDRGAFGELWRRHYRSGIAVASSITSRFDPDDLVQEAYARIFQAIERGSGPTGSFRAYLFTSIRHTAAGWGRRDREVPIDEVEAIADPDAEAHATDEALDRSLTAQAYRSLPTRWQEVLWYTEIEQLKPAAVAPLLGMNATAVAQLAFRAREGLREAWIQAHLRSAPEGSACRWTIERLGAYARGNLGRRDTGKVDAHLAECARCAIVAAEAKDVSRRLALVLLPLTIGAGGATAYLATLQGSAGQAPARPRVDWAHGRSAPRPPRRTGTARGDRDAGRHPTGARRRRRPRVPVRTVRLRNARGVGVHRLAVPVEHRRGHRRPRHRDPAVGAVRLAARRLRRASVRPRSGGAARLRRRHDRVVDQRQPVGRPRVHGRRRDHRPRRRPATPRLTA